MRAEDQQFMVHVKEEVAVGGIYANRGSHLNSGFEKIY